VVDISGKNVLGFPKDVYELKKKENLNFSKAALLFRPNVK
jgi:hypothetical protein